MAYSNYVGYSDGFNVLLSKEGEAWSNISDSLGANLDNLVWSDTKSSKERFVTEHIAYNFNYNEIDEFLAESPSVAILKLKVRYSIECPEGVECSVSLQSYLAIDGVDLELSSQIIDGIATQEDNLQIRTAVASFYLNNIPEQEELTSEKFQFAVSFDGYNPSQQEISIKVYAVQVEIVNGTGGYLLVRTTNDVFLEYRNSASLADVEVNQIGGDKFYIYNVGDQPIQIGQGDINTSKGVVKFETQPWPPNIIEIGPKDNYENNFTYSAKDVGLNEETITILSNLGDFIFDLSFIANQETQVDFPTISPSYQNNQIANGSSFSLSSFPIGVTSIVTVKISNTGTSSLVISSVTVNGDGSLSSGSIGSGSSILPFSFGNINVNLSTNIEGTKSVNIQIVSNSQTNSVYNFTLIYAILQQSKIEFREGFSSGSTASTLIDGQENNFGVIERDRSLSRYFVLKNSGIYKDIIVNSITSSSPDMTPSGLPSFPFVLIPNNGNAISFSLVFETSEVGLKEGVLSISYQEGAINNSVIAGSPNSLSGGPILS